jgi:hypothetical protein
MLPWRDETPLLRFAVRAAIRNIAGATTPE